MSQFLGHNYIGGQRSANGDVKLHSVDATTGEALPQDFYQATAQEVDAAAKAAAQAYPAYRALSAARRAQFLDAIADELDALSDNFIDLVCRETALPAARIKGERGRTSGQMRLFASVLRRGDFYGARIDKALPDRQPLPRPDLRQYRIGLGPVAVFGASNFPLAFSVAGGDTASALAAGCPVIVKAHGAHPGTSELVGRAVAQAVNDCGLPEGVFSLLYGSGHEVGITLVTDPRIKAVGFTGSRSGGIALTQAAQARPEPIPVYAEMSSINPVYLFPAALHARGEALAQGFVASLTQGAGQFCTNPGLVIAVQGAALDRFVNRVSELLPRSPAQTMLTAGIFSAYAEGVEALTRHARLVAQGQAAQGPNQGQAHLFLASADAFLGNAHLQAEVFGATSLVVACADEEQVRRVSEHLEGQLTATLHLDEDDLVPARTLLPVLERKAGRLLVNGWPTGVEVCDAMVHGGPFPATSDSRSTSVGTAAILRFLRPVCYQDFPDSLLPTALQHSNPLLLRRLLDGRREA